MAVKRANRVPTAERLAVVAIRQALSRARAEDDRSKLDCWRQHWQQEWDKLPKAERASIRAAVRRRSRFLARVDDESYGLLLLCFRELERRAREARADGPSLFA